MPIISKFFLPLNRIYFTIIPYSYTMQYMYSCTYDTCIFVERDEMRENWDNACLSWTLKAKAKKTGGTYGKPGAKKEAAKERQKPQASGDQKTIKQLLGELYGDKDFLEKLLSEDSMYSVVHLMLHPFWLVKVMQSCAFLLIFAKDKKIIISFISFLIYCVMNNCSISWKKDWIEKAEDKVIHQHVL